MAGTHYDVLGVPADASAEQIRAAYIERARRLHPDALTGASAADVDAVRRAMQDVNEAWRILRDVDRRAAYDEGLRRVPEPQVRRTQGFDEPYEHAPAEPGDPAVVFVRAAPWVAVLVVLAIIFVFTAFARRGGGDPGRVIGSCITTAAGPPVEVDCDEPNDGRVVLVVDRPALCTAPARPVSVDDGWWCVR